MEQENVSKDPRSMQGLSAEGRGLESLTPKKLSAEDAELNDVHAALAFNDDVEKAARNTILPSRTLHQLIGVGFSLYLFFINAPISNVLRYTVLITVFVVMVVLAIWQLSTTRVRVAMRQDPYANTQMETGTWWYFLSFIILMSFIWIPNFVRDSTGATPLWLLIPTSIGGGIYAYIGMSLGFLNPQSDWYKRHQKSEYGNSKQSKGKQGNSAHSSSEQGASKRNKSYEGEGDANE